MNENSPRIQYEGGYTFIRVCPVCGRMVKPDETIMVNQDYPYREAENATCQKCGRVKMPYEGQI